MSNHFVKFLLTFSILLLYSCGDNCRDNICDGRSEFVEFRLLRNQVNAIFGPNAIVELDSIRTYLAYSPGVSTPIEFITQDRSISLFIEEGAPVVLELNDNIRDTFSIITTLFGWDDCCQFYRVDTVLMNDSVICTGFCVVPIDIEI